MNCEHGTTVDEGNVRCGHWRVRSPGGIVPLRICAICPWRNTPNDRPQQQFTSSPNGTLAVDSELGPGGWLSVLLRYIGFKYTADCDCHSQATKMDVNGIEWSRANVNETLDVMRSEAANRGLRFIELQAMWLIDLAISLAESKRHPTIYEKARLRLMRLGNRIVNGSN